MEAKEYLDLLRDEKLRDEKEILRLASYDGEHCNGRGDAVVIDKEYQIAVMLQDCGFPDETRIKAGAIVKFIRHPEAEPKIVGSPAYVHAVVLGGKKLQ